MNLTAERICPYALFVLVVVVEMLVVVVVVSMLTRSSHAFCHRVLDVRIEI